jgi:hypothetical protein
LRGVVGADSPRPGVDRGGDWTATFASGGASTETMLNRGSNFAERAHSADAISLCVEEMWGQQLLTYNGRPFSGTGRREFSLSRH